MMGIQSSGIGSANATSNTSGGAGATEVEADAAGGFMALIGALLQGTALPDGALAAVLPQGQGAEGEGAAAGEETLDADALLAALGSLAVPTPVPAQPRAEAAQGRAGTTSPGALPGAAASAQGQAAAGNAIAADLALATAEETLAVAAEAARPDASRADTDADPQPSPWTVAAGRVAAAQETARAAAAATDGALREPVGTPRWRDELGAQLTMMAAQGRQSGSLRLSPEHLGPLEIQIDVASDRSTTVQFGAHNAETRAALQEALPRLREMFESAGLQLADAGVSGDAPRARPEEVRVAGESPDARDGEPSRDAAPVSTVTHRGLLDTYA